MGTSGTQHQQLTLVTDLVRRFIDVRNITEELCRPLGAEDFMLSVTEDTSPPKWHLAHTSWFFEHFILQRFNACFESYRPEYDFLFNSYYKRIGSYISKGKRNVLSRPSLHEVMLYRQHVTESVLSFLELRGNQLGEVLKVLELGINHEEQHQELLLMDIKRNFFENPLKPQYQREVFLSGEIMDSTWIKFHSGLVKVGIPTEYQSFAYDNEKDQHQVWMESFELSSHLVTNDEYINFIDDGGYHNPSFWLSDGWDIKEKESWEHPLYWEKQRGDWWTMTLSGQVPLEIAAAVVHISYYEAAAFAKWKGCRLPTEEEWETAARLEKIQGEFLDQSYKEPAPANENYEVFSQMHGTVWEWTQSSYRPYSRFKPFEHGMSEYNEKFMCNQIVMRGGSCITPKSHYRLTYRNFFYPHQRWMYGGIRLAKDVV